LIGYKKRILFSRPQETVAHALKSGASCLIAEPTLHVSRAAFCGHLAAAERTA